MIQKLVINNWHPTLQNKWDGRHWSARSKLKKFDRELIAVEAHNQEITRARGKRRVTLELVLGPRQRGGDPDAYWKSLLDAMVHAKLLTDDNAAGVELMPVRVWPERGKIKSATVYMEDMG